MPNTYSIKHGYPLSNNELNKIRGMGKSPMRDFMDFMATRDHVHYFDDFLGDTINLDNYALANSGGANAVDFAINVASGGEIRATIGETDNGYVSLIGPAIWYGDRNAGLEMRVKLSHVTAVNLEVGFLDGAEATGGVNDEDTPTFSATDAALLTVDTDETFTKLGFYTEGSTANQDVKRTSLGKIPGLTGTTDALPVADTYFTVRIQTVGNSAFCWVNGVLAASHNDDLQGNLEGGVALAPWVYARTRDTTASKYVHVDYIRVWQDRA